MARPCGALALLLVLACWTPIAHAQGKNPLATVLNLLDALTAKIIADGEKEQKAFKEFADWCEEASRNKQFEIKTADMRKQDLEAAIGKATGDAEAAAAKIEELASSIATGETDLKSATAIREKEFSEFATSETELMESIDTLNRAITILEREAKKNPAALAQMDTKNVDKFVQSLSAVVDAAAFTSADKQRLYALVQAQQKADTDSDDDGLGAPAAAAYKSRSGSIVDTLEDLREKAEEQLGELRKAETNAKHNFEMLRQSLVDQVAADTKDLNDEKVSKASYEEARAVAEDELAKTIKALDDGSQALEVVKGDCLTTAADHEAAVQARDEELKVIAQAKTLLEESTAGASDKTYSFIQLGYATNTNTNTNARSSLQSRDDLARAEVLTLVKQLAKEHHSAALAQLASRIAATMKLGASSGEDPFAKVRALISDMIAKLEAQAGSDATEKAYCDEQLSKTEAKKGELEFDVSKLSSKIDTSSAKSTSLKQQVAEVEAELAALTRSQAVMDKTRFDEHAAYLEAKADLEAGLNGVRKALGVLRECYAADTPAPAAMLQDAASLREAMEQPAAPQKHTKSTGAGTSIIGILEVVESDFAKNLATVETEEADAQAEYDKLTQENAVTKTLKEQDVKYATQEFKNLDKSVAELTTDRDTVSAELAAVLDYYAQIKERCIAKPETYEERARRREAEIAGLKEALTILEEETAFTQRSKKGRHAHFLGLHY